jgi:outer membrane protein assembly factor BamB
MITTLIRWFVRAVVAAGIFLIASSLRAADWPQWRGVNRDGISPEKGLLAEWPAGEPALLWKATGLGNGFASVAIAGGKAVTMGARDDAEYVMALDLATRKELWAVKVGPAFKESRGNGPRCTPTVDGGLVFALGAGEGDLVCVDAATGREVWRKNLAQDFGGKVMSGWGWSESPLVDGDRVICSPGVKEAILVALDKKTGRVIWKTALPESAASGKGGAGYASSVVTEAGGIRQYVAFTGRGLVGVAAKDGKYLWSYSGAANGTANCTTPVVRGDYVFVSSAYGAGSALVKLSPAAGGIKADEVYRLDAKTFANHHGGVVLVGDYLYGGHGQGGGLPVCLEFLTGKIMWQAAKPAGKRSAAVVSADGHLFFRYESGEVALMAASPAGYKLQGVFSAASVTGPAWACPVISGGRLFLRDNDVLLCYDLQKKP